MSIPEWTSFGLFWNHQHSQLSAEALGMTEFLIWPSGRSHWLLFLHDGACQELSSIGVLEVLEIPKLREIEAGQPKRFYLWPRVVVYSTKIQIPIEELIASPGFWKPSTCEQPSPIILGTVENFRRSIYSRSLVDSRTFCRSSPI